MEEGPGRDGVSPHRTQQDPAEGNAAQTTGQALVGTMHQTMGTPRIRHDGTRCQRAGETPQGLLLPEHKVVDEEHVAKAKSSGVHASEYRSERTTGSGGSVPPSSSS